MRDDHGIQISGSYHKKILLQMGYYHGYKGYRFYRTRSNLFSFTNFDQIIAVYNFDTALKSLLFAPLVYVETTIKNYILDALVSNSDPTFENIFTEKLTDYTRLTGRSRDKILNNRLKLQKNIHSSVHMNYGKNMMVTNKINSGHPIPLWVIFEIISFGKLGDFVTQMHQDYRIKVLNDLGIYDRMDTNGSHLINHIFLLNELRNGVAHNHIIFDTRFKNRQINRSLLNDLVTKFGVSTVLFKSIADYIMLLVVYLRAFGETKNYLNKLIKEFESTVGELQKSIPRNEFDRILGTDIFVKINSVKQYIRR